MRNQSKLIFNFLLFSCLLCSSCIGSKLQSSIKSNYTGDIKKIFLITESKASFKKFADGVSEELQKEFGLRNIDLKSKFLLLTEVKRDTSTLKYLNDGFDADWLFEIKQAKASETFTRMPSTFNGGGWSGGGAVSSTILELDLTISDYRTRRTIWTGIMELSASNGLWGGLEQGKGITTAAKKIIKNLTEDGLLKPLEKGEK